MTDSRPRSRRLFRLVASALLVLTGVLVVLPGTASAASNSISGTVKAASPTYTHLSAIPGNPCAAGSVTTHYEVIAAKLVGPAASTLTVTLTPSGFTGNIGVYQGGFLPDSPVVNCFGNVAGTSSGATVTYTTPMGPLLAGFTEQTMYIVVAGQNPGDLGSFTLNVNSTGATSVVMSNETPTATPDTTAPVLSLPSNITAEATGSGGRVVTYSATANDAVDGSRPVSCAPASGSTFAITTTTVNCSSSDTSGNTRNGSFTVQIQDTTGPNISYNGMVSWQATSSAGAAVTYFITSTDLVDGSRPFSCTPASGATFPLGNNNISCSSTDTRGNTSTATFQVAVVDTAGPVLNLPSNITNEATGASGRVVSFTASATDAVVGSRPVTCTPASGSTFAITTTTVNCSSNDGTNSSTGSFTVKIQDTTAPTLNLPATITVQATGAAGATATYTATSTDIVDGSVTVSCDKASGATFANGTTTVNCSATDAHGNQATGTFQVKVVDTSGPVLSLPANITKEATGPTGAVVTFTATATDAVDGSRPVTCTPASGSTFAIGTATVNCSSTDLNSNT
ncbi:HYR domain-containing protein, partial [Nakamurella silvestris]